jgi:hypothetical protein
MVQFNQVLSKRLWVKVSTGTHCALFPTLPLRDVRRAFALAADRSQSMKVILSFE